MEDYQEEIEVIKDKFFYGLAEFKIRGEKHVPLSNESGTSQFKIVDYYDIKVAEIKQIKFEDYEILNSESVKVNKLNDILAKQKQKEFDKESFNLKVDEFQILNFTKIAHQQTEGDEISGFFQGVPVTFKMNRIETEIVYIEGYLTGRIEERKDGFYEESYNRDGSTSWKIFRNKCKEGLETGQIEDEKLRFRKEYFHGDCSRYWGDWIEKDKVCTQGKWNGKSRTSGNNIEREYYNSDCSTYWKFYRFDDPPKGCFGPILGFLGYLILISFFVFQFIYLIYSKNWTFLIIYSSVILLIVIFVWLIPVLSKFKTQIAKGFNWLSWIFVILLTTLLFNGIRSLFVNKNYRNNDNFEVIKDDSNSENSQDNSSATDNNSPKDTTINKSRVKKWVYLSWKDFDNQYYKGKFYLYDDDIESSKNRLSNVDYSNSLGSVYYSVYQNDKDKLDGIVEMLKSIRSTKKQSNNEFANTIVSMVQTMKYVVVIEKDCSLEANKNDLVVYEMLQSGIDCMGYQKFGLVTPVCFLNEKVGDCDSRTLLLYTIFKRFNYDVSIINSDFYEHSMLGLNLNNIKGAYKVFDGKKYYFWETTSKDFEVGFLPAEMGNTNFWNIVLI